MTFGSPHARTHAHLEALFIGRGAGRSDAAARTHLAQCVDCQALFERLAAADRMAAGDPDTAGPFERAFTRAGVEARFGAAPGEVGRRAFWAVGAFAATAAAAGLALHLHTPSESGTQARGEATTVHQVELMCVDPDRRAIDAPAPSTGHRLHCPATGQLKIAVMNVGPSEAALPYLTLFSVSHAGRANRLLPVDPEAGTVSMRVGEVPRLTGLGQSLRLQVNHEPGEWRVVALFTAAPLSPEALEARLDGPPQDAAVEIREEWRLTVE